MGKLMAKPGLKLLIQSRYGTLEKFSEHIGYSRHQITRVHSGESSPGLFFADVIAKGLDKEVSDLFDFYPLLKPYLKHNIKKMYESLGYDEKTFSEAVGIELSSLKTFRIGKCPLSLKLSKRILIALKMDDSVYSRDFYDMFEWCYKDKDGNLIVGGDFDAKKND